MRTTFIISSGPTEQWHTDKAIKNIIRPNQGATLSAVIKADFSLAEANTSVFYAIYISIVFGTENKVKGWIPRSVQILDFSF